MKSIAKLDSCRILSLKSAAIAMLFIVSLFSSCIPTKKVVYVDSKEEKAANYSTKDWEYKIQVGDRFYISIKDPTSRLNFGGDIVSKVSSEQIPNTIIQQPTINDYEVQNDGTVTLPIIGKVKIAEIPLNDLQEHLRKKCEGYITNPSIKVFMTNYNVTILGEARIPGFYQLITNKPSFFDAVGLAGDLTDFADRSKVQFIRKEKSGEVSIEYVDVMAPEFINSRFYYIRPNDVIHIRQLRVKKFSSENALPLILSTITTILTIFTIARTN